MAHFKSTNLSMCFLKRKEVKGKDIFSIKGTEGKKKLARRTPIICKEGTETMHMSPDVHSPAPPLHILQLFPSSVQLCSNQHNMR